MSWSRAAGLRRGSGPAAPWLLAGLALLAGGAPSAGRGEAAEAGPVADPAAPGAPRAPPVAEEILVTASRGPRRLRDSPAAATVLSREEIERAPAKTLDEVLRAVPSFGLFRGSSSLTADPSSQGANLRGIGPSAVSRSLVLVDGIPATDPFGGWVSWRAIPRLGIQRIEVVPGGGSALYGNYALGGVIQVFSRPTVGRSLEATVEGGSFESGLFALRAADRWGSLAAALEGEILGTRGHPVVAPSQRGAVDGNAAATHATAQARLEAEPAPGLSLALRAGVFREEQNGGTRFTSASVRRLAASGNARWEPPWGGALELSVFGQGGEFGQQRARIADTPAPRSAETPSARQSVPARDLGVGLWIASPPLSLAGTHTLGLGADARRIAGDTRETLFAADGTTLQRDAGGAQRLLGLFVQELYRPREELEIDLAVRLDRFENLAAYRSETTGSTRVAFPDRAGGQTSPKVGVRFRAFDLLTLRAGAYRAFRAPTLNELYRPFQVGPVLTLANQDLGPERLSGGELGWEVRPRGGLAGRVTGFWNELADPVVSVTTGPNQRQRQNLGRARIRGVEAEAGWQPGRSWRVALAYTLAESRVTGAPGQPQLLGKALPIDPRHRATLRVAFDEPRLFAAGAVVRYVGRQFEDDQNTLPLPAYALLDLSASRRLAPYLEAYLAVENLLDRSYLVGRAGGLDTVGQPRFVHGGLRLRLGGDTTPRWPRPPG